MICQIIWYFVLLCVLVRSNATGKFHARNQMNFDVTENGKSVNFSFPAKSVEARTKEVKIIKRGIVLVDEDFDVPSAIYAHENNSGTGSNLNSDIFEKTEGSGNDAFDEKEYNTNTTIEMNLTHTTKQMVFSDYPSTIQSTSMQPTKEMELEVTKNNTPSTDLESSGDEILITTKEYEVTEMTTFQTTLVHIEMPDICKNTTCSQDDLFVSLSEGQNLMVEGTNLSLLCKSNNSDMLYWYKCNGTEYFLQALGTNRELLFNIPNTKSVHSGTYKCVKWIDTETCCNLKLNFSVYEKPPYTYYIIILGLIVGTFVILCIVLSIQQTITLRTYTKQFVEKHGEVEQLL